MSSLPAWLQRMRWGLGHWLERPIRSTLLVDPITVTATGVALVALTIISTLSTVKTLGEAPLTQYQTNQLSDQLGKLPDKWIAEARSRFNRGEISGYQRKLLVQQAEQLRHQADVAAYRLQQVGSEQADKLLATGGLQVVVSAVFALEGQQLAKNLPADHLPSYAKRLAQVVGELGKSKTLGVEAVASSVDAIIGGLVSYTVRPDVDVDDLYASKKRGLERLLTQLSGVSGDKLMAAHLANYIHRLKRTKEDRPDQYDQILKRVAENVDRAGDLSEAKQRLSGGKVKSAWRTTRDLQQWLDAQVIAMQREEQKEREKRLAGVTAAFSASPVQGKAPLRVRFDASGSKGDIERFVWDFGDKRGGQGMIVDHIYQSKGEFRSSLTVHSTHGAKQTSSQNIAVTATRPTVSIRLGVAPKEVKVGERVQIHVNPQVTGLEYGQINVSVAVDGKRIGQTNHGGPLQGDLERSFQYAVPAGFTGGEHVVQAVVRVRATRDDKWVDGMTSSTFRVKVESEKKQAGPLDMFIGTWRGMVVIPTGDPELGTLRASMTFKISAAGNSKIRVNTSSPHPAAEPSSEIYDVKGNSAQVIKREFKDGMENYTTSKMTVVGEGGKRIIGSSRTLLFDPGPPREKVEDVSGSFFANRVK